MKKINKIVLTVCVAIGIGVYLNHNASLETKVAEPGEMTGFQSSLPKVEGSIHNPVVKVNPNLIIPDAGKEPAEIPEKIDLFQVKRLADGKKLEIEKLILEFDEVLNDKSRRDELKIKIDQITQEYNALILPVAVNAIKNK